MTRRLLSAAVLAGLLTAPVLPATAAEHAPAVATLKDRDGNTVGTVSLRETPKGVLLTADLDGLPEGTHAFHVHETGTCEGDFKSAGGHFAPDGKAHGFLSADGPHAGDFPNIEVPASRSLTVSYYSDRLSLGDALFDDDGAAIVVHQGADDYTSQPAGDAGERIACGVLGMRG